MPLERDPKSDAICVDAWSQTIADNKLALDAHQLALFWVVREPMAAADALAAAYLRVLAARMGGCRQADVAAANLERVACGLTIDTLMPLDIPDGPPA